MKSSQSGNGERCPVVPEHGRMWQLPSARQWCPDQWHDARGNALYEADGKTPAVGNPLYTVAKKR